MKVKTVYVEITNQCNLNCRTCYNRSGLNRERRELSAARLEEILQVFLPYGLERFLLSGGNPPCTQSLIPFWIWWGNTLRSLSASSLMAPTPTGSWPGM